MDGSRCGEPCTEAGRTGALVGYSNMWSPRVRRIIEKIRVIYLTPSFIHVKLGVHWSVMLHCSH